jgi:hypothetical protein
MRYLMFIPLLWCQVINAQQWAGPDKEACGDLGATLGSNDPCVDCCYLWTPTTDLSCSDCKNPVATPKMDMEYSVVVTDKNLRRKGMDVVKVTTTFTEMHFTPDHLVQGATESEVIASILNPGTADMPSEISWLITGTTYDCMLTQQGVDAKITPGDQYGKVKIRANNTTVAGCHVEKELPINNGVKDVYAIDLTAPSERMAKTGETLHVLNDVEVKVKAIPNEGGFTMGIPDWKQDAHGSITPHDGEANPSTFEQLPEDPINIKTSDYIAGDFPEAQPQVTIMRKRALVLSEIPVPIPGMDTLDKLLKKYFQFVDSPEFPCGGPAPFTMSISLPAFKTKVSQVEKYNSPELGAKAELTLEASVSASGRIYHPAATKTFDVEAFGHQLILCTRLYAELTGSLNLSIPGVKSDSLPDLGTKWHLVNPTLTAGFGISGNLELAFLVPGFKIDAKGKFASKLDLILEYISAESKLMHKIEIKPATASLTLGIKQETDPGKYEDFLPALLTQYLSKEVELFKPLTFGPWELHQF